jgi:predicted nuclease of predicted toxin-antitoxin system
MSLKILVDMNLTPEWVGRLTELGWESVHWSAVGNPKARDAEIMLWART